MIQEIKTARLVIRRFKADDWRDLYEYLSDGDVVRFEPYGVFSKEECKEAAIRRAKDESFWAVCMKDTEKVIGNLYFEKQNFDT